MTKSENNKWWTLLAVCIATFMLLLDVTVVNVALKSIGDDLKSHFDDLQWVVDAYALTLASFLLTFGALSDIFGRRRIFLSGIGLFVLASAACGFARTPLALNISRAVQGVGAAAMFATALALIAQEFHGKERGTAFGIWGAVTGAAVAVGPLVGGALTDTLGWQSIFMVNVPIGAIAIALTFWRVSNIHERRLGVGVDWPGLVSFSVALFLLILALVRGNDAGWTSAQVVGELLGAVLLLVAFFVVQMRSAHAMLDLKLFRKPTFIGASIAAATLSASIFSFFLYITLYLQNVLGYDPLAAGIRFLPTTLLSFVVAAVAGKASASVSVRGLMGFGLVFCGVGLFVVAILVSNDSGWVSAVSGLVIAGLGIGLVNPPLASTAVGVVEPQRSGMASGINSTFRQIGIATGIAGLGAIFQHSIISGVTSRIAHLPGVGPGQADAIARSVATGQVAQTIGQLPDQVKGATAMSVRAAFVHSLDTVAVVAGAIAIIGAVVVFMTVRTKDFVHSQADESAPVA